MTTQEAPPEQADSIGELRQALGWVSTDSPEEQAGTARVISQEVPVIAPMKTEEPPKVTEVGDLGQTPQQTVEQLQKIDEGQKQKANQEAGTYKQQLIQAGWTQESAHHAATQYARAQYQEARNTELTTSSERSAQANVAQHFGTKYGVDPASLVGFNDPAAMEAAAKRQKSTNDRITALEGSKSGPAKTPVQAFDSSSGGGMTQQQRKIAYATGKINLTTPEFKELFNR